MSIRSGKRESLSHVIRVLRKYIYLPDPDPLYITMGTVIANHMPGEPVWTMLVGGPSSGGSTLIANLLGVEYEDRDRANEDGTSWEVYPAVKTYGIDELRSPAALLSGTPKKDKSKDSTGGLLREIEKAGGTGVITISDFTPIINLPREQLAQVIDALRVIYDGKYERSIGSDGGRVLRWRGKVGVITKCTSIIETHTAMMGELGQRFIQWRYPVTDQVNEAHMAMGVRNKREMTVDISRALTTHVNRKLDTLKPGAHEIEQWESLWIQDAARLVCRLRSPVKREYGKSYSVEWTPQPENVGRIAKVMRSLFLGMLAVDVEERDAFSALRGIMWGCIPAQRLATFKAILAVIADSDGENVFNLDQLDRALTVFALRDSYRVISEATMRRAVEDMEHLGIVQVTKRKGLGGAKVYKFTDWVGEILTSLNVKG